MTRVTNVEAEVGGFARAVVARRVAILAGVPAVLDVLVAVHVPFGVTSHLAGWVASALTVAGVIAGAWSAHAVATPADPALNPTSSNGVALVEADVVAGMLRDLAAKASVPAVDLARLDRLAAQAKLLLDAAAAVEPTPIGDAAEVASRSAA